MPEKSRGDEPERPTGTAAEAIGPPGATEPRSRKGIEPPPPRAPVARRGEKTPPHATPSAPPPRRPRPRPPSPEPEPRERRVDLPPERTARAAHARAGGGEGPTTAEPRGLRPTALPAAARGGGRTGLRWRRLGFACRPRDRPGEREVHSFFSGNLHPEWFEKLETMMSNSSSEGDVLAFKNNRFSDKLYQDSMVITFKGSDLTFTKILTTFKVLDFSNNAFDGPIPESVGKLIALHGLNMSHNAFTGRIPSKLGDLAQLESLDLSRNKLSGVIPRDLTSLTYLAVLNLSYNNLTGMIPEGPQFSSFTNSSFEGNEGLCGKPHSKQCNSSGTGTLNSSVSSKDSIGTIVLFVFVGSGFGVGFAVAVVLSLVFQAKRWNCNRFLFYQ